MSGEASEEAVAPESDIPTEVVSMDGVASEEEAHNASRPERPSGIHKHKNNQESKIPISQLEIGTTVKGKVKTITAYGAFVDIGSSTDALLHVSRLSDDFVSNVEDVISKGQEVEVRIININSEKNQIGVSMRSEEADASAASSGSTPKGRQRPKRSGADRSAQKGVMEALVASDYSPDQFVEGEVVTTLDFGAFVRVDISQFGVEGVVGEIDGLVHISALMVGRCNNVNDVVKSGDKVQVRIKGIDAEGGKVSLSMISKEDEPDRKSVV